MNYLHMSLLTYETADSSYRDNIDFCCMNTLQTHCPYYSGFCNQISISSRHYMHIYIFRAYGNATFYKMNTQAEGTNCKLWLSRMGTTNGSHEWSHKSGPRMGTTDGSHKWRPKVEPTNTWVPLTHKRPYKEGLVTDHQLPSCIPYNVLSFSCYQCLF